MQAQRAASKECNPNLLEASTGSSENEYQKAAVVEVETVEGMGA